MLKNQLQTNRTIEVTERDYHILRLIGEQFCLSADHLKILGAKHSELATIQQDGILTESAYKRLYLRWEKAGYIQKDKVFGLMWFYLTSRGLELVGLDFKKWLPSWSERDHYRAINAVRLYLEDSYQAAVLQWTSERFLWAEAREQGKHLADGAVTFDGSHIAVEVELTRKSYQRHAEIFANLLIHYDYIWYFVDRPVLTNVHNHIERFCAEHGISQSDSRFVTLSMAELPPHYFDRRLKPYQHSSFARF